MTEERNQLNQEESDQEMSFADLFEMEENNRVVEVGNVAGGTIIGVEDDYYLVDVGDKAESYIPKSEFRLDGIEGIQVGDTVEVFVERR
ncbi:MAG: S1 RNA-binding domain-containing protein, partial [Desulfocapsaceae bacterium]|nr:S1 RNA-binding domain-containing protein [Desulfocapsaceae bacterium]